MRRLAARENGLTDSLCLSPSRMLVTAYCKRTRPGRRATRRPQVSPFAVSHPLSGTIIRGTLKTPNSQLVTPISIKLQRPDGCD
jgi:hypothetical protein